MRGGVLITAAVALAVFGISQGNVLGWTSPLVLGAAVTAACAAACFVAAETRHPAPLVRPRLLLRPGLRDGAMLAFLLGVWNGGELLVLSLYLQQTLRFSPLATGLIIAPQGLAGFSMGMLGPRLAGRLGVRRVLVLASAAATIGFAVLTRLPAAGYSPLLLVVVLVGFGGAGTAFGSIVLASRELADGDQGLAGGVINTSRQVGAAVGAALLPAVAVTVRGVSGDRAAMLAATAAALAATAVAWRAARQAGAGARPAVALRLSRADGRGYLTVCLTVSWPLRIVPSRWARRAMLLSWVTMIIVSPLSCQSFSSSPMISSLVSSSRLPVGSSASSTLGSFTSARAIATRCCWPPDSSPGRWRARSASPTEASASAARDFREALLTPSGTSAVSTFSCADRVGIRLKVWKMNPIELARTLVIAPSPSLVRSRPSSSREPEVARSRPPSSCSSVDFPWPVGPWMDSHSPSPISRLTPRSACTTSRPLG